MTASVVLCPPSISNSCTHLGHPPHRPPCTRPPAPPTHPHLLLPLHTHMPLSHTHLPLPTHTRLPLPPHPPAHQRCARAAALPGQLTGPNGAHAASVAKPRLPAGAGWLPGLLQNTRVCQSLEGPGFKGCKVARALGVARRSLSASPPTSKHACWDTASV